MSFKILTTRNEWGLSEFTRHESARIAIELSRESRKAEKRRELEASGNIVPEELKPATIQPLAWQAQQELAWARVKFIDKGASKSDFGKAEDLKPLFERVLKVWGSMEAFLEEYPSSAPELRSMQGTIRAVMDHFGSTKTFLAVTQKKSEYGGTPMEGDDMKAVFDRVKELWGDTVGYLNEYPPYVPGGHPMQATVRSVIDHFGSVENFIRETANRHVAVERK